MAEKPEKRIGYRAVTYRPEQWSLLKNFRQKAMQVMETLQSSNLESTVHGSIARGDVNKRSDVDVFIPFQASSFTVETALAKTSISVNRRSVVQATPTYAMKAYIETDENTSVSFPLMKMRTVEREFYKFSGEATLTNLKNNVRVRGVDKRLMLIEPTEKGHEESTIIGREEQTAKLLGITVETVLDRVHALVRRDEVGRTGVFIEKELAEDETFELALKKLADQNPAVRRRMKTA